MNIKLLRIPFVLVCLLALSVLASAQQNAAKPVAYTLGPKLAISKLKQGEADVYDVRGRVSFTVTAANSDDTVTGTITYLIPDDARQKIAELSGKALAQVPASITRKEVIMQFQKGTEPPIIHLELAPIELEVVGLKSRLNRVVFDITARQSENSKYTKEEMETLFTVWARQILAGRSRRGPIARMNKVINGEEDQQ
jgi:hypothetical protein